MIEWACCGVILQHIPYIFFCESCHFIEFRSQRVIGADIESACQVIHRYRANACYEDTCQGIACCSLDGIEEFSEISFAMGLYAVSLFMLLVCENLVGEVVVLVNEEINLLTRYFALGAKIV